jgi:hypothetical protein
MAMPKINIAVVTNKIFVIKDENNFPNKWWVMFGGLGVTRICNGVEVNDANRF